MSCLNVSAIPIVSGLLSVADSMSSDLKLNVRPEGLDLISSAKALFSDISASVGCWQSQMSADADVVSSGLKVSVAITCGTNLLNEYYLLVEEGYTILIDDRRIKVIGNE